MGTVAAGGDVLAYTCPAGETTILKDIRLYAPAGAVTRAFVYVSSGAGNVSIVERALANAEAFGLEVWVVLQPGHVIRVAATGNQVSWWLSGAELEGLAD